MSKRDELEYLASLSAPDIIAVTETWLHADVHDSEVVLPGYVLFRQDRMEGHHGGVILYVSERYSSKLELRYAAPQSSCEQLWCTIRTSTGQSLTVGVVYRSPDSTDFSWLDAMLPFVQTSRYCLVGDFNCPHVDWQVGSYTSSAGPVEREFLDFTLRFGMAQHVTCPTRMESTPSCLDLIFSGYRELVHEVLVSEPLGMSDHSVVKASLLLGRETFTPAIVRNYWKADFPTMRSMAAGLDWLLPPSATVEDLWDLFKHNLEVLCDACVPTKQPGRCARGPPWIDHEMKSWLKKRKRAWGDFVRIGAAAHGRYKTIRNMCKKMMRQKRALYETHLIDVADTQPKRIFAYVNRRRKQGQSIPDLLTSGDCMATGLSEKAEALADQFVSVYSVIPGQITPSLRDSPSEPVHLLSTVDFPVSQVEAALRSLDIGKSPGPDGIHPLVLRELAPELSVPLSHIFRLSMTTASLPLDWKKGVIKPLFKSGDRSFPGNYRPVCMTSILVKVMERFIRVAIDGHLRNSDAFSAAQHGFVTGRSCVTNLLTAREEWGASRDDHLAVHAVFIDFSKAFDRVDHNILLRKLRCSGIVGEVLNWIQAYLADRTWRVRVDGHLSAPRRAVSGVPQGSVLGPRMFTLYVNELPGLLSSRCLMFADDIKIWRTVNSDEDVNLLQEDLNVIEQWATSNRLPVNPDKSSVMRIGHGGLAPHYAMNGTPLQVTDCTRDLGVLIQGNLKTGSQTQSARAKGLRVLWALRRTFTCWSPRVFLKIHKAIVRPVLEYGAPAYHPCTLGEAVQLERVQRLGTRLVPELRGLTYSQRCATLDLFTLAYRRLRADLLMLYRVVVRRDHPDLASFLKLSHEPRTRGHPYKLEIQRSDNLPHIYRWSRRAVVVWNHLPEDVVRTGTVTLFKERLDSTLWPKLNNPDVCNVADTLSTLLERWKVND